MTARTKLLPGQKGTKSLVAEYGDALLCVRYRYDKRTNIRLKTVELIIEKKPWKPTRRRFLDDTVVHVKINFREKELREQAKAAQGKWDPIAKAWRIQYGKIKGSELEKLIILETGAKKPGL